MGCYDDEMKKQKLHGYTWSDDRFKSIVSPLYLGVVYGFESLEQGEAIFAGKKKGYAYTRLGNPTVAAFEEWLTAAEGGVKTFATSSGLSALLLLVMTLTKTKKEIVTSSFIYGGSYHQMHLLRQWGLHIKFVTDASSKTSWQEAITTNTALVLLETPSNPRVDLFDIAAIAQIAKNKGVLLVVDNTIATPALQKPLAFGADVVLHSVTKYLVRQSTGLGGSLTCSKKFYKQYGAELYDWFIHSGAVMHPMTAWFAVQNSHTLARDMQTFSDNALKVADFLSKQKKVQRVYYPHLKSSAHYQLALKQMPDGGSGLLAFELESFAAAKKFVNSLKHIIIAPHLGDVHDLIIHPASTTHSRLSDTELASVHITKELVRMSVGLGNMNETISDLRQALMNI